MARKKVISKTAESLANALAFVSVGIEEGGETYKAHARVVNDYIVTFNGQLCVGHPIVEKEFESICPHIPTLISAINKSGKTLALSINEKGNLSVKGENIRAIVPSILPEFMPPVMPDIQVAVLSDTIKEGFKALLPLVAEEADRPFEMAILLRANTMVALNGVVIFEYYHGVDLPPGLSIPKIAAKAITSVPEKLIGFGFTPGRSATFWFEGGAFIQTQLMEGQWPDVDNVFNTTPGEPADLPAGFFDGIEAVTTFSADGAIHFDEDKVRSGYANYGADGPVYGATYDVPGMVKGSVFSGKLLKLIKPVCAKMDYWSHDERGLFYGPVANGETVANLRGVIMKRRA